ncbi:hypothetical protein [Nocardioides sp.]|uniref:hypothetical protein n=1 Tax=Nocardioides sp. TaxID=35761 RepID=UPI0039E53EDC
MSENGGMFRWGVLAVLIAAIVAALAVLGVQASARGGNPFSTANDTQSARDAATSVARQFMLRVNTYGPDLLEGTTMPKYRELVEEVVTTTFKTDFEQNAPYAEATVAQVGLDRTTEVYATGVGSIDTDRGRATVLVAGAFTNSYPDADAPDDESKRVAADPQPYRVEVTLVRQGGAWKVDSFTPVGQDQQQTTSPSSSPSPSSSSSPSSEPSAGTPSGSVAP